MSELKNSLSRSEMQYCKQGVDINPDVPWLGGLLLLRPDSRVLGE